MKYNWFKAASKPEDIPAGIEMSTTPDKDESQMGMRESNLLGSPEMRDTNLLGTPGMRDTNLLGSPDLLGGDTPEVSPSPDQMERETTERISDIGENMKNLFG